MTPDDDDLPRERMRYEDFIDAVVVLGIAASAESYAQDEPKRTGSREGFEACRGKSYPQLLDMLGPARKAAVEMMCTEPDAIDTYWRLTCVAAEIEWTLNVVSCALEMSGYSASLCVMMTARGATTAERILSGRQLVMSYPPSTVEADHTPTGSGWSGGSTIGGPS